MLARDKLEDLLVSCGAHRRRHSGRSLYHHLRGTEFLLRTWECAEEVCLAGLFHSVYGTSAFRQASLDVAQRARLVDAIGVSAERLVYLFHVCDRPGALLTALHSRVVENRLEGTPVPLQDWELKGLIEVECANLLEQGAGARFLTALASELPGQRLRLNASLTSAHMVS